MIAAQGRDDQSLRSLRAAADVPASREKRRRTRQLVRFTELHLERRLVFFGFKKIKLATLSGRVFLARNV